MGLDMEIRKVKKLELDPNVVYNRSDIHGMLLEKGFEQRPEYRALAPYVTSAKLRVTRLDKKKIMRRYHLSEEIGLSCILMMVESESATTKRGRSF